MIFDIWPLDTIFCPCVNKSMNQNFEFLGLSSFPTKIRYLCFCLSETIFLDNFIKKILNFINGTQMLHLYGTYEQVFIKIFLNYLRGGFVFWRRQPLTYLYDQSGRVKPRTKLKFSFCFRPLNRSDLVLQFEILIYHLGPSQGWMGKTQPSFHHLV